ncbi:hypothetical protein [Pseudomonas indica]|uniref:Uncharacterized protein n=1 Tax=Pseudomonas indica TaxID=137658 RepID=A0A1G9P6E0_9PSED|nr:hypothetical protein [Pseudomonas indica]MBU3059767.1 hypothetical protein [Pseudomonas indica]SDL94061.1 hypothetical protein SAMN05216186_13626 [Pseudomonas indica]
MTRHTEHQPDTPATQGRETLPPLFLLEPPAPRPQKDDWRLSRTAKPLRTWRLSK